MANESFNPELFEVVPPTLLGSECPDCGRRTFPPREVCPFCGELSNVQPRALSTTGTVYSYTIVRQAPPPIKTPYILAYVDLPQDQVRIMTRMDVETCSDMAIGAEVSLTSIILDDGNRPNGAIFAFALVAGSGSQ